MANLSSSPDNRIPTRDQLLNALTYFEDGDHGLEVAGTTLASLVARFGTPSLFYLPSRAAANAAAAMSAFRANRPRAQIHFALKSCYMPAVVGEVRATGAGIEVMSEFELQLADRAGVPRSDVIVTGIAPSDPLLADLAAHPPRCLVLDNMDDLRRTHKVLGARFAELPIALRVTPPSIGQRYVEEVSKLGTDWSSGDFLALYREATALGSGVVGLHSHSLSRCRDPKAYRSYVGQLVQIAMTCAAEVGRPFDFLDLGGGLDARFNLRLAGFDVEDFARAAADELQPLDPDMPIYLEFGRLVVGDAAFAVSSVVGSKVKGEVPFRFIDLASNILIPRPGQEYPVMAITRPEIGDPTPCAVGDTILTPSLHTRTSRIAGTTRGDTVAVANCGAYTLVFAESWAVPLPSVHWFAGAEIETEPDHGR